MRLSSRESKVIPLIPNLSIKAFDTWSIHYSDVVESKIIDKSQLKPSQFLNPGEGKIFTQLISKIIEAKDKDHAIRIIDLGAGSSLPTISALLKNHSMDVRVIAVDINQDALIVSKHNCKVAGLEDKYTFIHQDLIVFLKKFEFEPGDILVANPPYIPVKDNITDPFFLPIHAGNDGLKYLLPILLLSREKRVPLAFLASSLSSPCKLLNEINMGHNILYAEGTFVKFGKYLKQKIIRSYLETLRFHGQAEFYEDNLGNAEYLTLSFILDFK